MMPKKKSSQTAAESPTFPLRLTDQQREALVRTTDLPPEITKRIEAAPNGPQVIEFTKQELDRLDAELIDAQGRTKHPDTARIVAMHKKVNDLLETLLDHPEVSGVRRQRPADEADRIFQFKVTLLQITPPIWRRIQVEDCTLEDLSDYVQIAMGWDGWHMHEFVVNGQKYGPADEDGYCADVDVMDEYETRLSELLPKTAKRVRWSYVYDFGDDWRHEILFEGYPSREKGQKYPLCLEGERDCPPDDCGGPWGYYDLLDEITDVEDEEDEDEEYEDEDDEFIEPDEEFDPEAFDAKQVTREMRKVMSQQNDDRELPEEDDEWD
jgi:hypothetical protein